MWRRVVLSLALATLSGLLSTIDPLLMCRLIDIELPRHETLRALLLVIAIASCLLGRFAFLFMSMYTNFSIQQDVGQALRIAMLEQLNRLSAYYHESTPTGEKQSRLEGDVDNISELGADITSVSTRSLVFFIANVIVMVRLNTYITLLIIPFLAIFVWIRSYFRSPMQHRADRAQKESGRASSVLCEYLSAVPQLQLLCAEKLMVEKTQSVWTGLLRARKSQRKMELAYIGAINGVLVVASFVVLSVGSVQVARGILTVGGLVAFYAYVTRIFEPVSSMMELYSRSQRVGASIRRVREVLECDQSIEGLGNISTVGYPLARGISLRQVSFSYVRERPALEDVSLEICHGDCVALVGPSGSGKSTVARLLVRVADPALGQILLDGRPITEYSLAAIRTAVSYVPQKPVLFDGTVRENLLYGKPTATPVELQSVVVAAQLMPVLARFSKGLEAHIGPSGHRLSGGEAQRLAIARALLRDASVLILDESTSALDLPTERAVFEAIGRRRSASIVIVISHRLTSLTWVNRIVVMNRGRIVAAGNHDLLYAQFPQYRQLYDTDQRSAIN